MYKLLHSGVDETTRKHNELKEAGFTLVQEGNRFYYEKPGERIVKCSSRAQAVSYYYNRLKRNQR